MDPVTALTVLGTLAGVVAAIVATLQLRRTPARASVDGSARSAEQPRHGHGGSRDTAAETIDNPTPDVPDNGFLVLRPPTGRLAEVHGRDELLDALWECLQAPDGRFQVLGGLGGTGKTTAALALAEQAQHQGRQVWWMSATDSAFLTNCMLRLATDLGAPRSDIEQARTGLRSPADVLWDRLAEHSGWLLIIDNADDLGTLQVGGASARDGTGWLRHTTCGLLVVTSRVVDRRAWGRYGFVRIVGSLDEASGARVLLDLAPDAGGSQEAQVLSRRLGGLPLALHHAGAYLGSPFTDEDTFDTYMKELDQRFPDLLGGVADPRSEVTRTWEVSLDALAAQGERHARELLRVLSCFAPSTKIGPALLDTSILKGICEGNARHARRGLEALLSVGLLDNPAPGTGPAAGIGIVVHPLVAAASRLQLTAEITSTAAILLSTATLRLSDDDHQDWPAWLALLPHLRSLLTLPPMSLNKSAIKAISDATIRFCRALRWSGSWREPADLASAAIGLAQNLDIDHSSILSLQFQRATSAGIYQGNYREAEADLHAILDAQLRILGPDHPETLSTRHEIARLIVDEGRLGEAEELCETVLANETRILGAEHPQTLATRHYLLRAVGELGRRAEAEAGYRDLLKARTKVLGAAHPYTLTTYNNLAVQVAHQGRHAEAEAIYRDMSETGTPVLGPDHPYLLLARSNLAATLTDQGRQTEAEAALRIVLASELKLLGWKHIYTLDTRYELARAVAGQGRHQEAEEMFREVLVAMADVLGPHHFLAIDAQLELAKALAAQGKGREAQDLLRDLIDNQTPVLGSDHPRITSCLNLHGALSDGQAAKSPSD